MQALADTELIITPAGKIYHLDLHPDELADTVITVGDPARVGAISKHFDRIESRSAHREFVTHTGYLGQKRLSVLSTGIGPDNIDICLNELDALANIDFHTRTPKPHPRQLNIIRLGTSGSLQHDIKPGSLIISRYGLGLDNLLHFYQYQPNLAEAELMDAVLEMEKYVEKFPVRPYVCEGSGALADQLSAGGIEQGITITCPGFYAPQARSLRTPARMSIQTLDAWSKLSYQGVRLTNFEMETSAIFGLSRLLGHRAVSCNVILGNRLNGDFTDDPAGIVERMIAVMLPRIVGLD
ncbi:MAG: nucleoside phosphorylase [Haliscomenobacter sp.]|nr:nucleoside phosphorylase [Haliscomenobacter sp.]MBK9491316.1 nucleoside phosphorylase [Haliscomenobacter sp.]